MESCQIRPAMPEDAPVIAQFNSLMALETEGRPLDGETLRKGVEAVLKDSSKGIYYIAECNGTPVGQLMVTYEWSDWRNGNFWWIQSVYVKKDFRGRGVFKELYEFVARLASERDDVCGLRLYVDQHNARAKQTYERLGMSKTEYEMFEVDFVL